MVRQLLYLLPQTDMRFQGTIMASFLVRFGFQCRLLRKRIEVCQQSYIKHDSPELNIAQGGHCEQTHIEVSVFSGVPEGGASVCFWGMACCELRRWVLLESAMCMLKTRAVQQTVCPGEAWTRKSWRTLLEFSRSRCASSHILALQGQGQRAFRTARKLMLRIGMVLGFQATLY